MLFLALILSLVLQRFGRLCYYERVVVVLQQYFATMQQRVGGKASWEGAAGIGILVAIPFVVFALVDYWLTRHGSGFWLFLLNFFALWLTIDVVSFHKGSVEEPDLMLADAYHRIFAGLFWFLLMHASGAVLYFLVYQATQYNQSVDAQGKSWLSICLNVMDWLPVRLLGLSFALMGHFTQTYKTWSADVISGVISADKLLSQWAAASLHLHPTQDQATAQHKRDAAAALIDRCVIVWVVVISLLSITVV